MRISAGMAEIGFVNQNAKIASEKFFVWPLYNAGRVENIHGVTRRTESNITYAKPSPEDRDKMLALYKDNSMREYSSAGTFTQTARAIQPGSFFDAIA